MSRDTPGGDGDIQIEIQEVIRQLEKAVFFAGMGEPEYVLGMLEEAEASLAQARAYAEDRYEQYEQ